MPCRRVTYPGRLGRSSRQVCCTAKRPQVALHNKPLPILDCPLCPSLPCLPSLLLHSLQPHVYKFYSTTQHSGVEFLTINFRHGVWVGGQPTRAGPGAGLVYMAATACPAAPLVDAQLNIALTPSRVLLCSLPCLTSRRALPAHTACRCVSRAPGHVSIKSGAHCPATAVCQPRPRTRSACHAPCPALPCVALLCSALCCPALLCQCAQGKTHSNVCVAFFGAHEAWLHWSEAAGW